MRMPELEAAPLWIAVGFPASLTAGQRENVRPADGLLSPSQGFGHRSPHRDHNRRQNKIVSGSDQIFAVLALRLRIPQLDECCRRGADDVRLAPPFHHFINCFARSHGDRLYPDAFSATRAMIPAVELSRNLVDPLLLLRSVSEEQL